MMKLCIQNAHVNDGLSIDKIVDLYLDKDTLISIGEAPSDFMPDKVLDASGLTVVPSFVDLSHFITSKHSHITTEEFAHANQLGFGAILCHSRNNILFDSPSQITKIKSHSLQQDSVDVYPIAALTEDLAGLKVADLTACIDAGAIGVSNGLASIQDLKRLRNFYQYAASFDLKIYIYPQEATMCQGHMHEGLVSSRLGLPGIPSLAETIALKQHLSIIEDVGLKAHFHALSCAESVEIIHDAQQKNPDISADVSMAHLHLTEMDVSQFEANCHTLPPFRAQRDMQSLREGVRTGVIQAISSQHCPLTRLSKLAPFQETEMGVSMIDTFFSLGLHLVNQGVFDLTTLIAALTHHPAKIANIPGVGFKVGKKVNLKFIDTKAYWEVKADTIKSFGKNSPFLHWELPGKVVQPTF